MKQYITTIIALFFSTFGYTQVYNYKQYGVNDGLPSSQVYDIYQDKNGYLWFATDRGISRYNGYEFKNYGLQDGLTNLVVLNFHPQENGQIWCSTINSELFYFEDEFDGFKSYEYNHEIRKHIKGNAIIESILLEKDESLNLGMSHALNPSYLKLNENGKLVDIRDKQRYKGNGYWINMKKVKRNDHFLYYTVTEDYDADFSTEVIAISSLKGAYNIENNVFASINRLSIVLIDGEGIPIKTIESKERPINIVSLDEDHFMVGYNYGGAKIIDTSGNVINSFLEDKSVTYLHKDHQGGYWFATLNSGVYYLMNPNIQSLSSNDSLEEVRSIVKTDGDELFFSKGNGMIMSLTKDKISQIIHEPDVGYFNGIMSVSNQRNEVLFILKHHYLVSFDLEERTFRQYEAEKQMSFATNFSEEQEQGILFATRKGISVPINLDERTFKTVRTKKYITDAFYWNDEIFGASHEGVFRMQNDSLVKYPIDEVLDNTRIEDGDVDPLSNRLYLATLGKGLFIHDKSRTLNITTKDGLYTDVINEVLIEDSNTIWLGTNSGVNRVFFDTDSTFSVSGVNAANGLKSNEINDLEILNDTIWIASKKGLMYAPKSAFKKTDLEEEHYLRIKSVEVNNQETQLSNKLNYEENRLQFFVEGISFKEDKGLTYYYTLDGLHKGQWLETKNRAIRFNSLPPGEYTFKVTTCGKKDDCVNNLVSRTFIIAPPFWETWWFISSCILFIAFVIYLFFKIRILSYNKDIVRELIRLLLKKIKRGELYFQFRESGQDVRISTKEINYVQSAGNYIEIHTSEKCFTTRMKIGDFKEATPDKLEYIRVHRMYLVRIDKIQSKSRNKLVLHDGTEIPVGRTYVNELDKITYL